MLSVNTMKNLQLCPYRRVEGRDAYSFLPPISSSPQLGPGRAHPPTVVLGIVLLADDFCFPFPPPGF